MGFRTLLTVPLMREDTAIGAIVLRRIDAQLFNERQVALLETFADQAVIAIENVRLFKELQLRNRDLIEALEQQTVTSEVLKVISRSTFDLQPVLETLAENAARLCSADKAFIYRFESGFLDMVVAYNVSAELRDFVERNPVVPGRYSVTSRAALERQTIHIPDILADPEYSYLDSWEKRRAMAVLGVPMLRGDDLLGVITLNRSEASPFTDKQIELVTTFADQAVIAIENTRLLQELQTRNRDLSEALEQQTATSEILGVIASSPTNIQPVLDAVVESAARLCESSDAHIWRRESDRLLLVAHRGPIPIGAIGEASLALVRGTVAGRSVLDGRTFHVVDVQSEVDEFPEGSEDARRNGFRTLLTVPLMREDTAIGAIVLRRIDAQLFTERQVALLETFAD